MLDKEKTIKEAEEAIEMLAKVEEPTFQLDFVRVAFENALELLKQQGAWISVEDKLPGDCEMVMVKVYDDYYDTTWQFSGYYSHDEWYFSTTGKEIYSNWHPKYWLPIPESPEVEDEAD